ncbi:MAG: hypothetical protein KGH58_04245 [Candidatus Micrarchaeota archaeon]|nr:hypothetical protein [Candidatus Micrarchaeota archaeon]
MANRQTDLPNKTYYESANMLHGGLLRQGSSIDHRIREISRAFPSSVGRDIRDASAFVTNLPRIYEHNKAMDTKPSMRMLVDFGFEPVINMTALAFNGISEGAKVEIVGMFDRFQRSGMSHAESVIEGSIRFLQVTFGMASRELKIDVLAHSFSGAHGHYEAQKAEALATSNHAYYKEANATRATLLFLMDTILKGEADEMVRVGVTRMLSSNTESTGQFGV